MFMQCSKYLVLQGSCIKLEQKAKLQVMEVNIDLFPLTKNKQTRYTQRETSYLTTLQSYHDTTIKVGWKKVQFDSHLTYMKLTLTRRTGSLWFLGTQFLALTVEKHLYLTCSTIPTSARHLFSKHQLKMPKPS